MTLTSAQAREFGRKGGFGGENAFTEEEITNALLACVAWAGNASAAKRSLKAQGKRAPSDVTLADWMRDRYADRFNELREKHRDTLEQQLVHEYREVAALATAAERTAIARALERLEADEDKDPSRTAANLATVKDKNTRNMLALSGRPTSIREDRNGMEILRGLIAKHPGVFSLVDEEPAQIEEATSA